MTQKSVNRRTFIGKTGALAALPLVQIIPQSVAGANDRIEIGVIGCGSRGRETLMRDVAKFSEQENAAIAAVCDVWRQHREEAALNALEWYGKAPAQFEDFRDLLDLPNIDAVIIACPDHLHCEVLEKAADAGKDAYCEKPWAMELGELKRAVDAVRKHERIVQAGTQLRSMPSFTGCRKLVRQGTLGRIIKAEQVRNSYRPYWHSYVRPIKEEDTNWKLFLFNQKRQPFNSDVHSAWYGYRPFSSGAIGGFMSHFIDLVHYITGAEFPDNAVTIGGIYRWKDARTCPDGVQTILEYPEGFMVSYCTTFGNGSGSYMRFYGTRGSIDATDWNKPMMDGEGIDSPDKIEKKEQVPGVPMPHHMENWLQCLRTRKQPNANVDAGYQHAVACILSDMAMVENRRMRYDPRQRVIKPV